MQLPGLKSSASRKGPGPSPAPCARTFATHRKNMFLSATALVHGVNTTLLIVSGPERSTEWKSAALPHRFLFPGCPITSLFSSQKGHVCSLLFILNTSMTPTLLSDLPTALAECSDAGKKVMLLWPHFADGRVKSGEPYPLGYSRLDVQQLTEL